MGAPRSSKGREECAMLERIEPSPLHTMNRAVAIAEWQGPAAGLAVLKALASGA